MSILVEVSGYERADRNRSAVDGGEKPEAKAAKDGETSQANETGDQV
jgi:hypothetical protein